MSKSEPAGGFWNAQYILKRPDIYVDCLDGKIIMQSVGAQ